MSQNMPKVLLPGKFTKTDLANLKSKAIEVIDLYRHQLKELYITQFPSERDNLQKLEDFINSRGCSELDGSWVYYPWQKKVLHCVGPDDLFLLRTNRNKNIINAEEQNKLAGSVVGIAGMSVGAGIAVSLAYGGISRHMKIADFDELDTTNLNRLREGLLSVGKKKVALAAQHIYELDPFLTVEQFDSGINGQNIDQFFGNPKADLVIDEIDDFKVKVQLRLHAKKHRIPLLMFTSLGDNILVDVERYDVDYKTKPFNGIVGDLDADILSREITPEVIKQLSVKLVGANYIPTRALGSVAEMGKSLVGRPQLYSTIAVDGGLASYLVRQVILNSQPLSGRYYVEFAKLFNLPNLDLESTPERTEIFKKMST